jgi:hypothetical protein
VEEDISEFDIKCIDFGNQWLERWLKDENEFIESLDRSAPLRYCLDSTYKTLIKLGELPVWRGPGMEYEIVTEATERAKHWWPQADGSKLESLIRCVMVIIVLAEKKIVDNGDTDTNATENNS